MNTRPSSAPIVMAICILTATFSGCAANRVDLVDAGVLTLERQREGKVFIAWSSAYEQDDGFVITGVLMRHDHVGSAIKAHVDVTVLSADGRVIETARSNEVYVPRRITGRGQSFKRFTVHFPNLPPPGSSVRMVSHSKAHKDSA